MANGFTTLTFDIPNAKASRAADALPSLGYVFDPTLGTTQQQQKMAFFRRLTIDYWTSIVFNYERSLAIAAEPNDTAAEQAKRFVDLSDVTSSVS